MKSAILLVNSFLVLNTVPPTTVGDKPVLLDTDTLIVAQNTVSKPSKDSGAAASTSSAKTSGGSKANGTPVNGTHIVVPSKSTTVITTTKSGASSLQGGVARKGKYKTPPYTSKSNNPYSITKPFNPNNPPPINSSKIHPVSSNDH